MERAVVDHPFRFSRCRRLYRSKVLRSADSQTRFARFVNFAQNPIRFGRLILDFLVGIMQFQLHPPRALAQFVR